MAVSPEVETAGRLTVYRFRPVPWALLVGVSIASAVGVSWASRSGTFWDRSSFFLMIKSCALIIGLGAAFTVSADIDPPEAVLRPTPLAYWRTATLRLLVWLLIGGGVLLALAPTLSAKPLSMDSLGVLWESFLPDFLLVCGVCFLAASIFGSYVGGGLSFVAIGVLALGGSKLRRFPLGLIDAPPVRGDPLAVWHRWELGRAATGGLSIVLILVALLLLRDAGINRREQPAKNPRGSASG
jgi:hypothetical protein